MCWYNSGMTLNRLLIVIGMVVLLLTVGAVWLWQYAYSPEGRARIIVAQLKRDTTSFRGWLLKHELVRPGFREPPPEDKDWLGNPLDRDKSAADEMTKLGYKVLPVTIEALRDEDDYDMVCMAIRVCGKFHDPAAIRPLVKCMKDITRDHPLEPGDESRFFNFEGQYARLLVTSGPESFDFLMAATKECDYRARREIPRLIYQTWGKAALPYLLKLLNGYEFWVRYDAIGVLGELGDKRAVDPLVGLLSDSDRTARACAATALGDIGDRKAIDPLLTLLRKKESPRNEALNDHISAAGSLARMGKQEGLNYLLAMIKHHHPGIRADVATEMGGTGIKETFEPLLALLGDEDSCVRRNAAEALGRLHDRRAIPALKKLLSDSDLLIQDSANKVLAELEAQPPPASQPASDSTGK